MTAAETGHLVLGTLHARDTRSALTRIVDVFPAEQQPMIRAQLADSLIGVMSQRLVETAPGSGKRVLHPELTILREQPGGARATIHEGRFHQIISALETMNSQEGGSCYYSFDSTKRLLEEAGLLTTTNGAMSCTR
jgi:twitching motility protein PilT